MKSSKGTILIVDDDLFVRKGLGEVLEFESYEAVEAREGKEALEVLENAAIDLVLLDLQLPRMPGMEVLKLLFERYASIPVIVVSGKGTIRTAVEATRLGAYDFLEKPVDAQRLLLTVSHALEKSSLQAQRDRLLEEVLDRYKMIGLSSSMQRVYHLIDCAADTNTKVLITGETGTGKNLIARAIHQNSRRAHGPFVTLNCAAVPHDLIESELFGHEKGAFTGAHRTHQGKFSRAAGGTLFLDEIADMSLAMQAKILRVIEDEEVEALGAEGVESVDVRLVSATNKDLEEEVNQGRFRMDLFYRINVVTIYLPPLRARAEDLPKLCDYFLAIYCSSAGVQQKRFASQALRVLMQHKWPGNVRELRNVVEKCAVFTPGPVIDQQTVLHALNTPTHRQVDNASSSLRDAREAFECDFITKSLIANRWQIQKTADALGIDRTYLWKKMKSCGIGSAEA